MSKEDGDKTPENVTDSDDFKERRMFEDVLKRQDEEYWPHDLSDTQRERLRRLRQEYLRQPNEALPHKRKGQKQNISQFPKKPKPDEPGK